MRLTYLLPLCFFFSATALGQRPVNLDSITTILETVYKLDTGPRLVLDSLQKKYGFNGPEVMKEVAVMEKQDSANKIIVTNILDKYGWLGAKETSEKANTALFLVIQHADLATQIKYLPVLKNAVKEDKAKPHYYAYLLDRTNIKQGKFQIYGSQLSDRTGELCFDPIADEPNLNLRRKQVGLNSMEEHADELGIKYSLPKVDSLKNKIILFVRVFENGKPLSDVIVYLRSNQEIGNTNEKGVSKIVLEKSFLNQPIVFRKEGYSPYTYVLDGDKEMFTINVGLQKN